jgi:hypothetical protein
MKTTIIYLVIIFIKQASSWDNLVLTMRQKSLLDSQQIRIAGKAESKVFFLYRNHDWPTVGQMVTNLFFTGTVPSIF